MFDTAYLKDTRTQLASLHCLRDCLRDFPAKALALCPAHDANIHSSESFWKYF